MTSPIEDRDRSVGPERVVRDTSHPGSDVVGVAQHLGRSGQVDAADARVGLASETSATSKNVDTRGSERMSHRQARTDLLTFILAHARCLEGVAEAARVFAEEHNARP
jgi:hypothetical protein